MIERLVSWVSFVGSAFTVVGFAAFAAIVGSAVAVAAAVMLACEPKAPARVPVHMACEPLHFDDHADGYTAGYRCANAEAVCYLRDGALSCIERKTP